jgi:2-hydroxychromene-2-carboxylate isomerase
MLTLFTTLVSFLAGGLPKLLGFFQDRADKSHELTMARLQTERELELRKAGFEAAQRVEEIKVEGQAIEAEASERAALYAHDIAIGQGASQWMINLRAGVRPILTYGFFGLFTFVEVGGFIYAWHRDIAFDVLIQKLWDDDSQIIFASIISFHFGGRAFKGGKD